MKSELKEQTKLFLSSKQNANLLPEILSSLYMKGGPDLLQSFKCFKLIFTEILRRGDLNYEAYPAGSPDREYSVWLRDRYIEGAEDLAKIMQTNGSPKLREIGIETLVGFYNLEQELADTFPKIDHKLIISLIEAFIEADSKLLNNSSKIMESLLSLRFRLDFMNQFMDILEVSNKSTTKPREEWMRNVLKLVRVILKSEATSAQAGTESGETNEGSAKAFKRRFGKLWNLIMKWDGMTPAVVRQIVTMLPDHVMEYLEKPILMSDFLLESFKISGPLGVLSLRGIFVLMVKYNFEVSDFYTKLYSLFELPVLRSNYRARFFRYSADFLASTHLPEYLVAAFVKKLSRMCLHAPAPAIPLICQFIVNLMINHPGLKVLIHNTSLDKAKDLTSDPFDENEMNPSQTKAMESSLWEMKSLQNHILPTVAQACSFVEKPLPTVSYDLEEVLAIDYDDMFEEEINKKKNIGHLDSKPFAPFDYAFSTPLQRLADSVYSNAAKRIKV